MLAYTTGKVALYLNYTRQRKYVALASMTPVQSFCFPAWSPSESGAFLCYLLVHKNPPCPPPPPPLRDRLSALPVARAHTHGHVVTRGVSEQGGVRSLFAPRERERDGIERERERGVASSLVVYRKNKCWLSDELCTCCMDDECRRWLPVQPLRCCRR